MITECIFDPLVDVAVVEPGLSPDLGELMATHTVFDTGTLVNYSKETSTAEVGHYIQDKIDAAIIAMNIGESMASGSLAGSQAANASLSPSLEGQAAANAAAVSASTSSTPAAD